MCEKNVLKRQKGSENFRGSCFQYGEQDISRNTDAASHF